MTIQEVIHGEEGRKFGPNIRIPCNEEGLEVVSKVKELIIRGMGVKDNTKKESSPQTTKILKPTESPTEDEKKPSSIRDLILNNYRGETTIFSKLWWKVSKEIPSITRDDVSAELDLLVKEGHLKRESQILF